MEEMTMEYGESLINRLASEYGFSASEALNRFQEVKFVRKTKGEKKKRVTEPKASRIDKPGLPLPWCGTALGEQCCHGIRLNHGLYTQCTNNHLDSGEYCQTCQRQADMHGKPTYGTIEDRIEQGADYRDPKGKGVVHYGNVLKKLKIEKASAEREALKFGMTLTDEDYVSKEGKRGRPRKTDVSDSESSTGLSETKRPRGRPKKDRPIQSSGDDLIAALAQSVQNADIKIEFNDVVEATTEELEQSETTSKKKKKKKKTNMSDDDAEAAPITESESKKKKKKKKKSSEHDQTEEFTMDTITANSPKAETPKAETPKEATPKAETPMAETPMAETPKEDEPKTVKCKIVIQDGNKFAITGDNDAYYAEGANEGEYYGTYDPETTVVTMDVCDSDEDEE